MFAVIEADGSRWAVAFYPRANGRIWKVHAFTASWCDVAAEVVGLLGPRDRFPPNCDRMAQVRPPDEVV